MKGMYLRRMRATATSLALTAILVGCTADLPMTPGAAARSGDVLAAPPDIGGGWSWRSVEKLTLPADVAEVFGIPATTPVVRLSCESAGTLELSQSGSSFQGQALRTGITCETADGYGFVPPAEFAPPVITIANGVIRGLSFGFATTGPLPGEYHGVISGIDGGTASALSGTGRTTIPGHPHSPVPLPPPPGGTSKTILWEAVRP